MNINRAVIEGGEAKAKSPERCKVLFFCFAFLLLGKVPSFSFRGSLGWNGRPHEHIPCQHYRFSYTSCCRRSIWVEIPPPSLASHLDYIPMMLLTMMTTPRTTMTTTISSGHSLRAVGVFFFFFSIDREAGILRAPAQVPILACLLLPLSKPLF